MDVCKLTAHAAAGCKRALHSLGTLRLCTYLESRGVAWLGVPSAPPTPEPWLARLPRRVPMSEMLRSMRSRREDRDCRLLTDRALSICRRKGALSSQLLGPVRSLTASKTL